MAETKKAFIVRKFRDAGTETNFTPSIGGQPDTMPDLDAGMFANYAAAGLVRPPSDDDLKISAKAKPAA